MAPVHLLKLDGIPGELELESVAWSEAGTARAEPATIAFTARASAASAALFLACADGRKIASAVLMVVEGEGPRQPGRKWAFTDVSVSGYSTAGGPEGPVDQVVLRAELVEALPQPRPPTLRLRLRPGRRPPQPGDRDREPAGRRRGGRPGPGGRRRGVVRRS